MAIILKRRAAAPPPRCVPTWEQRFCWEVGRMPWMGLLNSKEYMHDSHRVIYWNDSAGEEAFNAAKRRYRAKISRLPCKIHLPSTDKYIDEVEWNPNSISNNNNNVFDDHAEVLDGLDEASWVDQEQEEEENNVLLKSSFEVSFHQIKPTGWDGDYGGDDRRNHLLTGMVVRE